MARTRNRRLVPAKKYVRKTRGRFPVRHHRKQAGVHIPRRPLFPLSARQAMDHKYLTTISLDPGAGSYGYYRFRTNSLFDPDHTGVGHQPMYFDQMAALYKEYVVTGAKIIVTLYPQTSLGEAIALYDVPVLIVSKENDTDNPTDPGTIIEQGTLHQNYRVVKSDDTPTTVRLGWSLRKSEAVTDIMNPDWVSTATGNPSAASYFRVVYGNFAGENVAAIRCLVELRYHAIWFNPIEQNQS